ncbi:acyltransferase domain-containing protein [Nonomuraea spiralis]|uniref:acyltransferase domain-containing protein n=1 Tax=Nonomuraea spiralis TaxID=46182 RepID=UPI0037A0DF28
MRSKVVAVFPGSVAIPPSGALTALAAGTPAVPALLSDIDAVAAEYGASQVSAYLLTPDAPRPPGPEAHYLALMAVSLATFDALAREGLQPYALVGQGLGELWALVAAGVLSVRDGARLACERSRALTELGWDGTMMPLGVSAVRGRRLVGLLDHPDLVVGCDNSPRQCVLSGPREMMPLAARIAEQLGWTTTDQPNWRAAEQPGWMGRGLQVPHPAHTPAVAAAATGLRRRLRGVEAAAARWPVFSPTLRRMLTADDDPVAVTANAMVVTVHFHQAITVLSARGAEVFVECGAREDAAELVRAIVPTATVSSPLADGRWPPPSVPTPTPPPNGSTPPTSARTAPTPPTPAPAAQAPTVPTPTASAPLVPPLNGPARNGPVPAPDGADLAPTPGPKGHSGRRWSDGGDVAGLEQVMRLRLTPAPPLLPAPDRALPPATLLLCGYADAALLRALTDDRDDVVVADADTIDWNWLPLTPRHLRVVARPGPGAELVHETMFAAAVRFPQLRSVAALVMDAVREEVVPDPVAALFTGTIRPLAAELPGCACVAVAAGDVELPAALDALAAELEAAPPLLTAVYRGSQRLLYDLAPAIPVPGERPWTGSGRSRPSAAGTA